MPRARLGGAAQPARKQCSYTATRDTTWRGAAPAGAAAADTSAPPRTSAAWCHVALNFLDSALISDASQKALSKLGQGGAWGPGAREFRGIKGIPPAALTRKRKRMRSGKWEYLMIPRSGIMRKCKIEAEKPAE